MTLLGEYRLPLASYFINLHKINDPRLNLMFSTTSYPYTILNTIVLTTL
jgi:hypothetical protein